MEHGPGRRSVRPTLLVVVALVGGVIGCSGGGSENEGAAVEPLPPTTAAPSGECDVVAIEVAETLPGDADRGVAPTLPEGVDTGYTGSGPGSGNPYTVPGARQVPGPDMTVTTLGPEPSSVAVAVPPNPDFGSPPGLPAGATTVPAPPTTLPPTATTTPGESTATTGLMEMADDPGCVAVAGDP